MTLISRYLFRNLLTATVFATLALTMTIWITQSLRLIDLVINAGAPFTVFFKMMLLTVPTFIGIILPVALAGAILFTYNKLTQDSELVVMRAVGFGPWHLARPALVLALLISLVVFLLNLFASPAANRELVRLQYAVKHEFASVLIREGTFSDVGKNLTVYLRNRADNGDMEGLLVYDTRTAGKEVTLIAQKGALGDAPGGIRIVMVDGLRQEVDIASGRMSELYFDRYVVDFRLFDEKIEDRFPDSRERSMKELLRPPPEILSNPQQMRQFAAELHMRLSTPILAISFTFIAVTCLLFGEYNRRGQGQRLAIAVLLVVILQVASIGLTGLANKNLVFGPLMYLIYALPILPAAWVLSHR
ncbi:MAG: LPS export ABC transporter permease LptF [Azospirillum sp.]|nr:LPS export ABC transporter permease LptF [Azospirillum sp.]